MVPFPYTFTALSPNSFLLEIFTKAICYIKWDMWAQVPIQGPNKIDGILQCNSIDINSQYEAWGCSLEVGGLHNRHEAQLLSPAPQKKKRSKQKEVVLTNILRKRQGSAS